MSVYRITASSCDDLTSVFVELTDEEADVVRRVAEAITAESDLGCMPTLRVYAWGDRPIPGDQDGNGYDPERDAVPELGRAS